MVVFGTIDDHDYGCNNGDKTFQYSKQSGIEFLNFVNENKDSPMYKRAQKGLGVYGVKLFDFDTKQYSHDQSNNTSSFLIPDDVAKLDPDLDLDLDLSNNGQASYQYSKKTVAIFVLDVRTNKTPWRKGLKRFKPDFEGDFLGETQWKWFETALSRSKASINIIVQGLQVHPTKRFPDSEMAEMWDKFPTAQQRLYSVILNNTLHASFLISGDVHMSQLMRKDCFYKPPSSSFSPSFHKRTLMELTTSGMTHSWGTCVSPRKHLHTTSWFSSYAYFASKAIMSFMYIIIPMPDVVTSLDTSSLYDSNIYVHGGAEGSKQGKQFALDLNFAELEFDWDQQTLVSRVFGTNTTKSPLISAKWSFDQLSGVSPFPIQSNNFKTNLQHHFNDQWTCLPVEDIPSQYHIVFSRILGIIFTIWMIFSPLFIFFCGFFFILQRAWRRYCCKGQHPKTTIEKKRI